MARYIRLDESNIVTQIRTGVSILEGEIESLDGEIGQKYEDGVFVDVPVDNNIVEDMQIKDEILLETKYQTILLEMIYDFK